MFSHENYDIYDTSHVKCEKVKKKKNLMYHINVFTLNVNDIHNIWLNMNYIKF